MFRQASPESALRRAIDQVAAGLSRTIDGDFDLHITVSDDIQDISVQRLVVLSNSLLQNIRDQIGRATAAAQAKADFLASVSHELRTPLAAVVGNAELLRQTSFPREQQDLLDTIAASADVMHRLIGDVLDLARYDAGSLAIATEVIDLRALLMQVAATVAAAGDRRNTPIDVQCAPTVASWISSDRLRLTQVLLNLLTNAAKFGAGRRVAVVATTEAELESSFPADAVVAQHVLADERPREDADLADTLVIMIRDHGEGIAAVPLAALGTPFRQSNPLSDQRRGGSGLGLVITARLVAALGGRLVIRSALGHGTEVQIHLPHVRAAAPAPSAAPVGRLDGEGLRVLVCDDSEPLRRMVARFLGDTGVEVTLAADGDEAADLLARRHFHILLVDEQMPGRNGSAVVAGIGAEVRARMRCILMSAGLEAVAARGGADLARFDAVMAKPFRREELRDLLREEIGRLDRVDRLDTRLWLDNFGDLPAPEQQALLQAVAADLHGLQAALAAGQTPEAGRLAHRLVSSASCIGYPVLGSRLADLLGGASPDTGWRQMRYDLRLVADHIAGRRAG